MKKTLSFISIILCLAIQVSASDTLTVGVKHSPPFIIKDTIDGGYSGLCIELWENIAEKTGVEYRYKEYTLDGILNALTDSSVDLCINPLSVTSRRMQNIMFTQPIYISNLGIAVKGGEKRLAVAVMENIFSYAFIKAILFLIALILIVGFGLWVFERKKNPDQFRDGIKGVFDGFWWSAVTMTTVGYGDKAPQSGFGRLLAIIWMFAAVIVISSFTASISSSLTVDRLKYNIQSVEELGKYKVACINGSSAATVLHESKVHYTHYKSVNAMLTALDKGEVEMVFYDTPILQYELYSKAEYDDLQMLPGKFKSQYYSFSFPKGSRLFNSYNQQLVSELEDQKWEEILDKFHLLD